MHERGCRIDLLPAPRAVVILLGSTFQFVLNVGSQVAALDPQQALLRSGSCEIRDSPHATHDSRGCVVRHTQDCPNFLR
jgi:hypothetical protein